MEVKLIDDAPAWFIWITSLGPFFVGVGSLAVACAVAYIAHQQLETNRSAVAIAEKKRADDLFDRQLNSLTKTIEFVNKVVMMEKVEQQDLDSYVADGGYSGCFLFNSEVEEFFDKVYLSAKDVHLQGAKKPDGTFRESFVFLGTVSTQEDVMDQIASTLRTY